MAGSRKWATGVTVLGVALARMAQAQYPTYQEVCPVILAKVSEITSGTAYYTSNNGSSLSTATGRHMLELRFSVGALSGGGAGAGGVQNGLLETVTNQSTGGGGSGSGGGGGGGNQDYTTDTYALGVVGYAGGLPLAQLGLTTSAAGSSPFAATNYLSLGPGVWVKLNAGDNVGVEIMASTSDPTSTILGTYIDVVAEVFATLHHWNGTQWVVTTTATYQVVTYQIEKLQAPSCAAIDARRCYGQPNLDGELPADPNAPPENPSFPGWLYMGGLFVGNMPWATGDQSSTSRTQFDFGTPPSGDNSAKLRASTLSCYYTGAPSTANGGATIGVYLPGLGGGAPYNWGIQWKVAPRATPSNPPNYADDPVDQLSFTSTSTPGYCNWSLMQIAVVNGVLTGTFEGLCQYYVLCVADEPDFVRSNGCAWQYFASPAYQALYPNTALLADSAPRIWNVYAVSSTGWLPG